VKKGEEREQRVEKEESPFFSDQFQGESNSISNFQIKFGTDRLEAEEGKNLKLESFVFLPFCLIFGKKSQGK